MSEDTKHFFTRVETAWNYRRSASTWHFDPEVQGEPTANVNLNFVKFRGDWSDEIANTDYKWWGKQLCDIGNYIDRLYVQEEIALGVRGDIMGEDCKVTKDSHPKIWKIVDAMGFMNPKATLLKHTPGCMAPLHMDSICDGFNRKATVQTKEDVTNADKTLARVFIQMTDWSWGQFFLAGNCTWTQWKAGDVMFFDWPNIPHASANAGHLDRHLLKITGIITDKFRSLLQEKDHIIYI